MGATPKAGYTEGMIGATPVGNAYVLSGEAFGWLCPRPISLPARLSRLAVVGVAEYKAVRASLTRSSPVDFCGGGVW